MLILVILLLATPLGMVELKGKRSSVAVIVVDGTIACDVVELLIIILGLFFCLREQDVIMLVLVSLNSWGFLGCKMTGTEAMEDFVILEAADGMEAVEILDEIVGGGLGLIGTIFEVVPLGTKEVITLLLLDGVRVGGNGRGSFGASTKLGVLLLLLLLRMYSDEEGTVLLVYFEDDEA